MCVHPWEEAVERWMSEHVDSLGSKEGWGGSEIFAWEFSSQLQTAGLANTVTVKSASRLKLTQLIYVETNTELTK